MAALATAEGTNAMKRIEGRLYLCTKSIVFEPNDMSRGIIRYPFEKMTIGPSYRDIDTLIMLRQERKHLLKVSIRGVAVSLEPIIPVESK